MASGRCTWLLALAEVLNRPLGTPFASGVAAAREGEARHGAGDPGRLPALPGHRVERPLADGLRRLLV